MIPKKIWTIWLNDDLKIPDWIFQCIESQKIPGYEHELITLNNFPNCNVKYLNECIEAKKWAKAADYLRIWILEKEGGIYLDADVEMVEGKNFDDLLNNWMFVGREKNNFVSNAIIGAEAHHPILQDYLELVEQNFIGSGELVYQPGMYLFTELVHNSLEVKVYPPEYFLPYDWQTDVMEPTENTRCIHFFNKSWKK